MFGWITLGAQWRTEQAYLVLELFRHYRLPCRMPDDDMFFIDAFHLPHPDMRWEIHVRRRDLDRATALLIREGLINGATLTDRAEPARPILHRRHAQPHAVVLGAVQPDQVAGVRR